MYILVVNFIQNDGTFLKFSTSSMRRWTVYICWLGVTYLSFFTFYELLEEKKNYTNVYVAGSIDVIVPVHLHMTFHAWIKQLTWHGTREVTQRELDNCGISQYLVLLIFSLSTITSYFEN